MLEHANEAAYVRGDADAVFREWSSARLLREAVEADPERVALIVPASSDGRPERRWTYGALAAEAESTARALLRHFAAGDRVATWAGGSAEILMLQLGAALAGITLVTLNPANRSAELLYMLTKSRARGLFYARSFRGMDNIAVLESLRPRLPLLETVVAMEDWSSFVAAGADSSAPLPEVAPDSPALILFTSGSTGKPKAAVLHHAGIVNNAALTAQQLGARPQGVWLNVLPMFHVGGSVTMTLGVIANRGTQVLMTEFTVDGMLDALARYRVTLTMAVPTMLVGMLNCERLPETDLSALETIVAGGSAVAPDLVRRVRERMGAEVAALMGQTEAGGAMFCTRRGDDLDKVSSSVGFPLPLSEARIVRTRDGATASRGEIGEMCVRTPFRMTEYFDAPEKTRDTIDAEGWLHTGDLGFMRPDGYLQITGRLKEMIIRGGENIYPREIEDVLVEHEDVAQAAVYGVPDEKWGEQVAAAIIPRAGRTPDFEVLTAFLNARIARHKTPKFWRVVEAFPLNASGKIQKFVLQEQFTPGSSLP